MAPGVVQESVLTKHKVKVGAGNDESAQHSTQAAFRTEKQISNQQDDKSKWSQRRSAWYSHLKLAAAPILASLILSILTLVKPTSKAIGAYAYLMFPFLHLFFYPSPSTIGSHIETVLFSIIGGVFGSGYAFLATSASVWIDGQNEPIYDTSRSRALSACMLVILAFFGGWLSSSVPRLRSAVRIALFNSTWAIGNGASEISYSSIKLLLHPTFVTAGVSLLCNLICWPKTSGEEFTGLISKGLDITCRLLDQTIDDFFPNQQEEETASPQRPTQLKDGMKFDKRVLGTPSDRLISLRSEMLETTSHLQTSLESSEYEITFGRIPISQHKEHVAILGHIRSWISCGMGLSVGTKATLVARAAGVGVGILESEKREIEKDVEEYPELIEPEDDFQEQEEGSNQLKETEKNQDQSNQENPQLQFNSNLVEEISISMFETSIRSLTREVIYSLQLVRTCVLLSHSKSSSNKFFHKNKEIKSTLLTAAMIGGIEIDSDLSAPDRAVLRQRKKLAMAVENFQIELLKAQDGMKGQIETDRKNSINEDEPKDDGKKDSKKKGASDTSGPDPSAFFRNDFYAVSFLMVSLLEVATETSAALRVCQSKLRFWHAHPHPRIWWPVWSWSKGGSASHLDDSFGFMRHDRNGMGEDDNLKEEKERNEREGLQEEELREREKQILTRWNSRASGTSSVGDQVLGAGLNTTTTSTTRARANGATFPSKDSFDHSPTKISHFTRITIQKIESFSRRPSVLKFRLFLSHFLLSLKHSRHLRFAIKLALGVALLGLPSWLYGSPRRWWEEKRGAWVVISFIYVLEFSTGATVRVSAWRILGTIAGGISGALIWFISGEGNPYALAFLLTLMELPVAYFILFTSAPGIGNVMGVTAPIIPLIQYIDVENESSVINLAWTRGYQIALGIIAALIINLILYPYHARIQLVRHVSRGTNQLQSLYLSLSRQLLRVGHVTSSESRADFESIENTLQARLAWSRSLIQLMDLELSLVPKPTKLLAEIIERLQTIADLLSGLRRIRERGLRAIKTEAVMNVLSSRTEMVSSILLTFYVVGQALSTRAPLPQFLPSPRLALESLTQALEKQLSKASEPHSIDDDPAPDNHGGTSTPPKAKIARSFWCPVDSPMTGRTPEESRSNTPNRHHRNVSRTATPIQHSKDQSQQGASRDHSPKPKRKHNALFYLLSEHALLADIIGELEALLVLTRALVGEASFISTSYLPRSEGARTGFGQSPHDLHAISMSLTHMQGLTLQRELAANGLGSNGDTMQNASSNKELLPRSISSVPQASQPHSIVKPTAMSPLNPRNAASTSAESSTAKIQVETNQEDKRHFSVLEQLQEKVSDSQNSAENNDEEPVDSTSKQSQASNLAGTSASSGRDALKSLFEQ